MTPSKNLFAFALLISAVAARADFFPANEAFVGIDSLQTIGGTPGNGYAGLVNPNYNRLTFLYGHQYDGSEAPADQSHFHSKGTFVYSGLASSPTIVRSASYYLPEGTNPPLNLLPGSGALSAYGISGLESRHFANTTFRPVSWLDRDGAQPWEKAAYGSSAGRWTGSLGKANLALEVMGLTSGLRILNSDGTVAASTTGDLFGLGSGDFATTPIFAVNQSAVGAYTAQLRLRDLNGNFGDSGVFEYRFQAQPVPEPATLAALGIGALDLLRRRKVR